MRGVLVTSTLLVPLILVMEGGNLTGLGATNRGYNVYYYILIIWQNLSVNVIYVLSTMVQLIFIN